MLNHPSRDLKVGDPIIVHEDAPIVSQWPLARVINYHPGKDERFRVATIKTCWTKQKEQI